MVNVEFIKSMQIGKLMRFFQISIYSIFQLQHHKLFLSMLTDIVTKSFHNLKLQRNMNILKENYSSKDSYNLKLQIIMSRFILEKNQMLTNIVTKSLLNLYIFQFPLVWVGPKLKKFNYVLITIIIVTKFTVERLHEMYQCAYLYN